MSADVTLIVGIKKLSREVWVMHKYLNSRELMRVSRRKYNNAMLSAERIFSTNFSSIQKYAH